MSEHHHPYLLPFEFYLSLLTDKPDIHFRSVFQIFHDMVKTYVGEGYDEYPDDPESIKYVHYDCDKLFVEGLDHPFFADRLFANRLINHVDAMRRGAQQNKIYIFEGPPGSGKSTFLNNLLLKFEEYSNSEAGKRYETVWLLDQKMMGFLDEKEKSAMSEILYQNFFRPSLSKENGLVKEDGESPKNDTEDSNSVMDHDPDDILDNGIDDLESKFFKRGYIEIPCPSHDHPILMIPKNYRRKFFDDLLKNDEFKWKLFTEKEYEWVFRETSCTVCSSLYQSILQILKSPLKVFEMLYVRQYVFNRRIGEGVSVFNPGDRPMKQVVQSNPMLQNQIDGVLRDSNKVRYVFSNYAKTNNGIYALMDTKAHNKDRLIRLHNIISEGVHKVGPIEENVKSLFIALMNPEDKKDIADIQSFSDRIEYIYTPYILDLKTEVNIYQSIFGKHITEHFLPRVLENFARVIISTRLNEKSEGLTEWIGDPQKYSLYCDENLHLLKMAIYSGYIPEWLSEEDRKNFTSKKRKKVIGESEREGVDGLSGRDSIKLFHEFYSASSKTDKMIDMATLYKYFAKLRKDLMTKIPTGFLDSLMKLYNYSILQEVKESLFYYNEKQISKDIQNYIFAVNFEPGIVEKCNYTGDKVDISEEFYS
ncbi:MAG: serine protein kinase PrkA, partial [bacterium]|nr:serine protein kinase PrkA [bacterium]